MPTPQPAAEFSVRDVLQQVDHRLSLIETDVRENNAKIDDLKAETEVKIDNLRTEIIDKIDGLEAKTEAKIDGLEAKTEAKIDDLKAEIEVKIDNLRTEIIDKIDGLEAKTETKIEVEIRELRREFNGKFNLVIGLVLTTWLSMMATLLFKL